MSCTVMLLPAMIVGIAQIAVDLASSANNNFDKSHLKEKLLSNNQNDLTDVVNIICKEYDTIYADVNLLVKTLQEHGVKDLQYTDNKVSCRFESFAMDFVRQSEYEAFKMKITQDCNINCENTIAELNSEYAINTQEESYIKIKQDLEAQNMQIADEEVLEDNSIVITVNVD